MNHEAPDFSRGEEVTLKYINDLIQKGGFNLTTKIKETKEFQAETKQLLELMIHSIYTNHEIFLRELLSNASDALDKVRFESLTNPLLENDSELAIYLERNEAERTLTITDNGIGMTYDEVITNIGTIAKSGTKAFVERLKAAPSQPDEMDLIGQFGVGFYSAFMVAERVVLTTRAASATTGVRWESTGDGTFTIEETTKEQRGTIITIYLKEEFTNTEKQSENFLSTYTISNLVKKYSDYIRYPIKMELPAEKEGEPNEIKTLNSQKPLWTRPKQEITNDEYQEFYKNTFHDWEDAAEIIHTKVEGMVEYTALLYLPNKAPYDFYTRDFQPGLKLYSRNVFIMEKCQDILPEYLGFVKGLVDSPDFSLNISREILQHSKQLKLIGKNLEKSILKSLENLLQKDRQKYETFWAEFGRALKGAVYSEYENREKLQDFLLFNSSHSNELTTLSEYLSRMPETQTEIYYATGKDRATVESLPQLELVREKGFEVVYLFDRIDEFVIDTLREYKEKKFKSVSRGELNLQEENNDSVKDLKKQTSENSSLLQAVKTELAEKVTEVRLTNRLKSSPVCLVSEESGISIAMEQVLAEMDQANFKATRILELNSEHPVFNALQKLYQTDSNSTKFKEYCELLYGQALLLEGISPENPAAFASKIANLMVNAAE